MIIRKKQSVAIIQNMPAYNLEHSLSNALSLVEQAADSADMIILPEMFITPYELNLMQDASLLSNIAIEKLKIIANKYSVFICSGSLPVQRDKKLSNTSYLINSSGNVIYEYNKCHLFDVQLDDLTVQESKIFSAGNSASIIKTELGNIGISICYDIRFPELARKMTLQGMQAVCVPAAFSETTGKSHWHAVLRSRAIENQIYLYAASPARNPKSSYPAYGHSLIINPWGEIISEAGTDEEIIYGSVDLEFLENIRHKLPLLQHRRTDIY